MQNREEVNAENANKILVKISLELDWSLIVKDSLHLIGSIFRASNLNQDTKLLMLNNFKNILKESIKFNKRTTKI